jgi:deoxyribodipyrimidine photo-lyase
MSNIVQKNVTDKEIINIFWFRNDIRLEDNLALNKCINEDKPILFVYILENRFKTEFVDGNFSQFRKEFIKQGIIDLREQLHQYGQNLIYLEGDPEQEIKKISSKINVNKLFCEEIDAPFEKKIIENLKKTGIAIEEVWHSSMYLENQLPFEIEKLPDVFTHFRKNIEAIKLVPLAPEKLDLKLKKLPIVKCDIQSQEIKLFQQDFIGDCNIFSEFSGGERNGKKYLEKYFKENYAWIYKQTRNDLQGKNSSTKFSFWLAHGYLSARQIYNALKDYENKNGSNESTYWIWFELLWRDYFRFLHKKYKTKLYFSNGLGNHRNKNIKHSKANFDAFKNGKTDNQLINAGIRELKGTGYISNRMRQILASYLIWNLKCDWRGGADFFQQYLIDFDIYSNQGNWLYIAGFGTDPRGGRIFNVERQQTLYDKNKEYQNRWVN